MKVPISPHSHQYLLSVYYFYGSQLRGYEMISHYDFDWHLCLLWRNTSSDPVLIFLKRVLSLFTYIHCHFIEPALLHESLVCLTQPTCRTYTGGWGLEKQGPGLISQSCRLQQNSCNKNRGWRTSAQETSCHKHCPVINIDTQAPGVQESVHTWRCHTVWQPYLGSLVWSEFA